MNEEPTDEALEVAALRGEVGLLRADLEALRPNEGEPYEPAQLNWWAEEMLFWRTKYLMCHPEHATREYVQNARELERIDVKLFLEP